MPYLSLEQRAQPAAAYMREFLDVCLEELAARQPETVIQRLILWFTVETDLAKEFPERTYDATERGVRRAIERLLQGSVEGAECALLLVLALY